MTTGSAVSALRTLSRHTDRLLNRPEEYFWISDNQFRHKSDHSTECVYALIEFIEYFKSRSTSVYVGFLETKKQGV